MVQITQLSQFVTLKDRFLEIISQIDENRPDLNLIHPDGAPAYRALAIFLGHSEYRHDSAFKQLLDGRPIELISVFSLSARLNCAGFPNIPILFSQAGQPLTGELSTRCKTLLQGGVLTSKALSYFTGEYLRDVVRARRLAPGEYMPQAEVGERIDAPSIIPIIENAHGGSRTDKLERLLMLLFVDRHYFAEPRLVATA